jgi:hypothetical protein
MLSKEKSMIELWAVVINVVSLPYKFIKYSHINVKSICLIITNETDILHSCVISTFYIDHFL